MTPPEIHLVTGAFGYSGRVIAARLLEAGVRVRTLTGSPQREILLANGWKLSRSISRLPTG